MILKKAMLKAIIKVYSELLVTNFYAQISCIVHSKFVKIITILTYLSDCCVCLRKFSRINQIDLVSYMSHKLRAKVMGQLNFVQRLQIANQKGCSDFDTARTSLFLSQKYLTLLRMRRTNVPQIAVLNDRELGMVVFFLWCTLGKK